MARIESPPRRKPPRNDRPASVIRTIRGVPFLSYQALRYELLHAHLRCSLAHVERLCNKSHVCVSPHSVIFEKLQSSSRVNSCTVTSRVQIDRHVQNDDTRQSARIGRAAITAICLWEVGRVSYVF